MELDRLATRWAQLPMAQAERHMPRARLLLDQLTSRVGAPSVPDLGPAVVIDQLRVLVWDACAADAAHGIPDLLRDLRANLSEVS